MDWTLVALATAQGIETAAVGIATNIASQILINMASDGSPSHPVKVKTELHDGLCKCVIECLKGEPDDCNRLLLARCLFDDATIELIAASFVYGELTDTSIVNHIKSRLPVDIEWKQAEHPLTQGAKRFLDRLERCVSENQTLTNRVLLKQRRLGNEEAIRNRDLHQKTQDLLSELVKKNTLELPPNHTKEANSEAFCTASSPSLSSGGNFPENSNQAVLFLMDDFKNAFRELRFGSARKAHSSFTTIVERLEKIGIEKDENLYFRAKCNQGLAALAAGEPKEITIKCIESALCYAGSTTQGRINRALSFALQDKDDDAITILSAILLEDPDNVQALIHRGDAYLRKEERIKALQDFRKASPKEEDDKCNLAAAFLSANAYSEAESISELLLKDHPANPWGKIILSSALGIPIVESFNKDNIVSGYRPKSAIEKIKRAIALLEDSITWARSSDRPDKLLEVLTNLSAYHCALGNYRTALNLTEEAIKLPGCDATLHRNRFLAAILTKEFQQALESAIALERWLPRNEAILRKVEALNGLGRYAEGLNLIIDSKKSTDNQPPSVYLQVLEVDLTASLPDFERAKALASKLNELYPDESIAWLSTAELLKENDPTRAEECLRSAVAVAKTDGIKLQCQGLLGDHLGRTGRWAEALNMFLPNGCSDDQETPYLVEIATCYFNLGNHREALRFAERKLSIVYNFPACQLAIQCCLAMVELDKAKALAITMQKADPKNQVAAWSYLAHLEFRLNNPQKARTILLSAIAQQENAHLLLLLCNICQHLGHREEAISHAVQALTIAQEPQQLDCHRAIVSCAFNLPEQIILPENIQQQFQKSLSLLVRISDPTITTIPADPDFSGLKNILREQQQSAKEGELLFRRYFPIYFFARLANRDIDIIWKALTEDKNNQVHMSRGSEQEQAAQQDLADSCQGIVLDATSLLTFHHLNLLDRLPKIFNRVAIAFPLYEKFLHLLQNAKDGSHAAGILSLVGDQLHVQEFNTDSSRTERERFLRPIITFMEGIERLGFQEPTGISEADVLFKNADSSAWATLQVAKQNDLPLLCDDFGTLEYNRNSLNVRGFCSQTALRTAHHRRIISDIEYTEATFCLFESNYHFVSDDSHSVICYLRQRKWQLTPTVQKLFKRFDEGTVTAEMACQIMGAVLAQAWLQARLPGADRENWINFICERLCKTGDPVKNFRSALLGAAEIYLYTPDMFFAMVCEIHKSSILSRELLTQIDISAKATMLALGGSRHPIASVPRERWRELARLFVI